MPHDRLPGGLADSRMPQPLIRSELEKGIYHELEHTHDAGIAREIALDHLVEDPWYYSRLEQCHIGAARRALPPPPPTVLPLVELSEPERTVRAMEVAYRSRTTHPATPEPVPVEILWLDWLATPISRPAPLPQGLTKPKVGAARSAVKSWWRLRYYNPVTGRYKLTYLRYLSLSQAKRWRKVREKPASSGLLVILERWRPRYGWVDEGGNRAMT